MERKCAIIPSIKNKEGEYIKSRLFSDLLSYTKNREDAKKLYLLTKNDKFTTSYNLQYDENGEVTFDSLVNSIDVNKVLNLDKLLNQLNKSIGAFKNDGTPKRYIKEDDAFNKVKDFNINSPYRNNYIAKYTKVYDRTDNYIFWKIEVVPKTNLKSIESDLLEYNKVLNDKLRDILSSYGVSIGALTELEKRQKIAGVMDTTLAKESANGFIELIRLAEGIKGELALPEEFAHFAIEALGNDPLVNRLINNINPVEILGDNYESYSLLYKGNEELLAKEAAGKLLANHLLKNETIPESNYKSLLQRLIDKIKNFFKKIPVNLIQRATYEVDRLYSLVALDIIQGNINLKPSSINLTKLYSIDSRIARDKALLGKIIDTEIKRLNLYQTRNNNSFDEVLHLLINKLESSLAHNLEVEGIYEFLSHTMKQIEAISKRLNKLYADRNNAPKINETATTLREIRNFTSAYKGILDDITSTIRDESREESSRYDERVKTSLNLVKNLLSEVETDYNKIGIPLFILFIKPFIGDSLTVPLGKYKGKKVSIEELLTIAEEDIGFFDRWLDSMAESSDSMLRLMDASVKKSKEIARLRTIEIMKLILLAQDNLERAGVKDTSFMLEKVNGKYTGNFIRDLDYTTFKDNRKLEWERINTLNITDAQKYKLKQDWYKLNAVKDTNGYKPLESKYSSLAFKNLNSAQLEYYNTIINLKEELDALLPEKYTYLHKAVLIRKDLVERVKEASSVKEGLSLIADNIKDAFIRRVDDIDLGTKATIKDFENREVLLLPIYYTKKLENPNLISTDITSTMVAYAAMAIDYNEMNKVIDTLELGRDILRNREVIETEGGRAKIERIKALGRNIENKLTKPGNLSRILERLDDFFRMLIYGLYLADEGVINVLGLPIDKGKLANLINKLTSLNSFALNLLAGIANVGVGVHMMNSEAIAGEFFKVKDVTIGDKNYTTSLPEYLAEIGNRIHTSKLALWNELFNVLQDYELNILEVDNVRKNWFSRLLSTSTLFFINNAGEHWMQTRTSLALANTIKMKDKNGNIVSLWDAMETVPIDANNPKGGAKLKIKDGYTKEDGKPFTLEDIIAFSNKVKAINQRMHGIYNKADRSSIQRLAIGRLAMMFRKWMRPAYNRRYGKAIFNHDLNLWTEGYYRTAFSFIGLLTKDIRKGLFLLASLWNKLNKHLRANMLRASAEAGTLLIISSLLALVDFDDDTWAAKMVEYLLRRMSTEIGALVPGPQTLQEAFTILKSPAAGIDYMQRVTDLAYVWRYFDEILTGRYKGHNLLYKNIMETLPLNKPIYKALHPDESISFYK